MAVNAVYGTNTTNVQKTNTKKLDGIKGKLDINNNGSLKEEALTGLSALSAMAIAAIAIAKHKNPKVVPPIDNKAAETVRSTVQETGNKAAEAVSNAAQETAEQLKPKSTYKPKDNAQAAKEQLESAVDAYRSGAPYEKVKRSATKNLPHDSKKQVRAQLAEELQARRQEENGLREAGKNIQETINTASSNQNTAKHAITSKTIEGIDTQLEINSGASEAAQNAASAARELAEQNPTRKNIQRASHARQKADTIKANAKEQEILLNAKKERIAQEEEQRLQNALEQMESTTPEARQQGQIKMLNNADKTQIRAAQRDSRKLIEDKRTQGFIKKLGHKSPKALENIAQNSTNKFERCAAQELLKSLSA